MKNDLKNIIGLRIKQARTHKGLSQADLAEAVDRSVEAISNLERGINMPSVEKLQDICGVLDLDLQSLFETVPRSREAKERQMLIQKVLLTCQELDTSKLRIAIAQMNALRDP